VEQTPRVIARLGQEGSMIMIPLKKIFCSDCSDRSDISKYVEGLEKENATLKDQKRRRNMQVANLKKKLGEALDVCINLMNHHDFYRIETPKEILFRFNDLLNRK
jgi:hypothetical protein